MLPLSYAVRNLFRVPARLLQIVLGGGLVILLLMLAAALSEGMDGVLRSSGSEKNIIVLGTGSEESVERSEIKASVPSELEAAVSGLEEVLGRVAVSPEIHYNGLLTLGDGPGDSRQALFRGVTPAALLVHPEVRLVEGTFPRAGEIMVGRLAAHRLGVGEAALKPGTQVKVGSTTLRISGIFQAPGTVMEAELWADLNDLRAIGQRDTISCVVVRLDSATFDDVEVFTLQRLDLELAAIRESDYYAKLAAFYTPLRIMTWVTAGLVVAGAVFGGMNTLYAAFASRVREMATLQAVGYSRKALAFSLLQESLLASLLGSLFAAVIALAFADGLSVPFSIGTFLLRITPGILGLGVLGGLTLAIIGTLPPAWTCLRPELPAALRSA
ncbi:ABC transporter permease [Verrucomicrobium sp. BvORR106]|uniref:ABC transporter permease n=1 Tax=Verrucomicrobium sp. BvORR106 TaxID=1403819 RepID=UPI0005706A7E|nr:ABC transporter permease [Verrucomicrobium sp. BvORR106]